MITLTKLEQVMTVKWSFKSKITCLCLNNKIILTRLIELKRPQFDKNYFIYFIFSKEIHLFFTYLQDQNL
jgi:hypothetical protein